MEKITKSILSADIAMYKPNITQIEIFYKIGHSLPSATTCRKTVLQLIADELKRKRNAGYEKQIFLVFDNRCNGVVLGASASQSVNLQFIPKSSHTKRL